ncbi:TIGR00266 family protein [Alkalibacterium putridalgicola]|uniref:TIGR00266 family protein n=1 Tax=Alkalibacterium putridalgicola TaxID=426703 RepID=A0A1H7UJ08_9LACT|nr:TIGR00266 family protein [Alkalibacterium putridalgicola]GEK88265.1 TIGR00266 family protein [Alkalibacterium putridalgicola]SEL97050.1 TIGR00266 family protein [Alkalibacterium putridalgicola]
MKFEIQGEYPVLRCMMDRGETIITSSGNMSWMTEGFELETSSRGGLLKGFSRAFSGESMFQNRYNATKDNQEIAFASSLPGKIVHIDMNGREIMTQRSAYLASTEGVDFEVALTKKFSTGLLGGEGFVLQRFSGRGDLFLEADGSLVEYELGPGEALMVDQGHVFMFDESITYSIETVKGLKNMMFGGEGAFLVKLLGPGKVTLQTMPISNLAAKIVPYVPTKG